MNSLMEMVVASAVARVVAGAAVAAVVVVVAVAATATAGVSERALSDATNRRGITSVAWAFMVITQV
jgi:hypothetical protein